jgi:amino acid transporter
VEVAFGPFVGFLAGVLLWLLSTFAMSAVANVFASNAGALLPFLSTSGGRVGFFVLLFGGFAVVNVRGVEQGARVVNIATVAKLLPLLLLAIGGWAGVRAENLVVESWPTVPTLARSAIVLTFAFAGIEAALVPGGEVRDPAKTVPRAILFAMSGVTLLYVVLQLVARGTLGEGLSTATATPLADAARVALGGWAGTTLIVGASVAMLGHAGGMLLAVSRLLYAFARDGFLPRSLAAVHPARRTPHVAIVVQAVIAILLAATSSFERLAILANISVLLLYAGCCLAAWSLRRRDVQESGPPFRAPGGAIIPWVACGAIAWMLTSIRASEWAAVVASLTASAVVYAAVRRRTGPVVS